MKIEMRFLRYLSAVTKAASFWMSVPSIAAGSSMLQCAVIGCPGQEVGGVFRQEHEAGSDIPDRLSHRLSFVRAEIVDDDGVARLQGGHEEFIDIV
jgi:hypothetical protein